MTPLRPSPSTFLLFMYPRLCALRSFLLRQYLWYTVQSKILATPAVRRLCREMSVDPSREPISGTGPGGRVLKGDVLAYVAAKTGAAVPQMTRAGTAGERDSGVVGPQQHQQHEGDLSELAAHGAHRKPPSTVVRHDNDDPGSVLGRPFESPREEGRMAARRTSGSVAVGVEVEEVEEMEKGETQTRKASGVREMKQPVPLPIKGDATQHREGTGGGSGRGRRVLVLYLPLPPFNFESHALLVVFRWMTGLLLRMLPTARVCKGVLGVCFELGSEE